MALFLGVIRGYNFIMIDLLLLLAQSQTTLNEPLPTQIGTCTQTFIEDISYRLASLDDNGVYIPMPGSGSAVTFANGGYQVSYDHVPAIHQSLREDPVRICLKFIPDCSEAKPGDERGKIYLTTNLRTGMSWELPDSQHSCGGA
jgi:hypothetical protein